ncbi:ion transporter [Virgibacillus phasianinus]|uniref:Ion transporter n=1 Tax=Virgibacillus phasianinus TaxID=2017483 RepID=A0A220U8F7_9BACI|nr:ion transporter [Virgibacillus phasianinus]
MWFLTRVYPKLNQTGNIRLALLVIAVFGFSSYFIHYLEPETFPSTFEGLWWVLTTVTTVGYGDVSPHTTEGKILGIFLFVIGIGLMGVVIGKVVNLFSLYRTLKEEGKLPYTKSNHYVLLGWSKKTKSTLKELLYEGEDRDIVLIAELAQSPYRHEKVTFIQGNPGNREALIDANVAKAASVLIFSDDSIQDSSLSDGKSLLIASSIEKLSFDLNESIYTIVEVQKEDHIDNFKHLKVDEFVISDETFSRIMAKASRYHGSSLIYTKLTSDLEGENIYQITSDKEWNTYRDAFISLLEKGATLLADGDKLNINQRLDEKIPEDARLFVVCSVDTYKQYWKKVK